MTDHDVAALLQSLVDSIARASTRLTARARAVFDAFIGVTTSGYDAPAMAYVRVRSERERAVARYLR